MNYQRRSIVQAATGLTIAVALAAPATAAGSGPLSTERTVGVPSSPIDIAVTAGVKHHIDWNWQVANAVVPPDAAAKKDPGAVRNIAVESGSDTHGFTYQVTVTPSRQDFLLVSGTVEITNLTREPMRIENALITIAAEGEQITSPPMTQLAGSVSISPGESRELEFAYLVVNGGPGSTQTVNEFLGQPRVVDVRIIRAGGEESLAPQTRLAETTPTQSDDAADLTVTAYEFDGPMTLETATWDGEPWTFEFLAPRIAERYGLPLDITPDGQKIRAWGTSGLGVFPTWAQISPARGEVPEWVSGVDQAAADLVDAEVVTMTPHDLLQLEVNDVQGEYARHFDWTVSTTEVGERGQVFGSPIQLTKPGKGTEFEFKTEVRASEIDSTPLALTGTISVTNDAPIERSLKSLTVLVDGTEFPGSLVDPPRAIPPASTEVIDFVVEIEPGDLADDSGDPIDVYTGTRVVTAEAQFATLSATGAARFDVADAQATVTGETAVLTHDVAVTKGVPDGFDHPGGDFAARYGGHVELNADDESWAFNYPVSLGEHLQIPGLQATFANTATVTPSDDKEPVSDQEVVRVAIGEPLYLEGFVNLNVEEKVDWTLAETVLDDDGHEVRRVTATPTITQTTSSATGAITVWNPNVTWAYVTMYGLTDLVDASGEPFPVNLELVSIYNEPIDPANPPGDLRVPPRYAHRMGPLRLGVRLTFPTIDPADFPALSAVVGWDASLLATEADSASIPLRLQQSEPASDGPTEITVLAELAQRPEIRASRTGNAELTLVGPAIRDSAGAAWVLGEAALPDGATLYYSLPTRTDAARLTWRDGAVSAGPGISAERQVRVGVIR